MGLKEILSSKVGQLLPESKRRQGAVWLVERFWQIEIEGEENLEKARKHLRKGSLMVIFNHSFSGDGFCGSAVCLRAFRGDLKHWAVPAARKHLDLNRAFKNFVFQEEMSRSEAGKLIRDILVIRSITNLLKVEVMSIVQSHDQEYYGEEVASRSWRKMFRQARQILPQPGTMLLHSPEGHRSEDGNLQRAKAGLIHLLIKGGENCLCLPMGISVNERSSPGLNFGAQVKVRVGEPFTYDDCLKYIRGEGNRRQEMVDGVMRERVAPLIPKDRGGYYQDFVTR